MRKAIKRFALTQALLGLYSMTMAAGVLGGVKNGILNAWIGDKKPSETTGAGKPEYCSLFTLTEAKTFTSESSSKLKLTANGYKNNDLVIITQTGTGGAGLIAGRVYFVIEEGANSFGISQTEGGPAESWTGETAGTWHISKITEIAVTSRIATAFGAAAKGVIEDSTAHAIEVPACTVNFASYHTAVTVGKVVAMNELNAETFGGTGKYTLNKTTFDALGSA